MICNQCRKDFIPHHGHARICDDCRIRRYEASLRLSRSEKAIEHRRAAFVKVLEKHGVKWGE